VCGPVIAELLKGARRPDRDTLWAFLRSLPWAPLEQEQWHRVGEVSAQLRERGASVPLTDVIIAASCTAAPAQLWTRDGDFDRIAPVMPELQRFDPDAGLGFL
jgi:predicted nucleic acid-binding protein